MLWTIVGVLLLIVLLPMAWRVVAHAFRALFGGRDGLELLGTLLFIAAVFTWMAFRS